MTHLRVYAGRSLSSTIPLLALPVAPEGDNPAEICVRGPYAPTPRILSQQAWRHAWLEEDGSTSLQVSQLEPDSESEPRRYQLRFPDQCDFEIVPALATMTVFALEAPPAHTLEHLLIDQALPRLLAGQGHLIVHASVASIQTRTALFLGSSGWGKSTMAGLLHRRGHQVFSDDCALLNPRNSRTLVTPAYPGLRLYEDSIEQAFPVPPITNAVSDYSNKQRVIGLTTPINLSGPQRLDAIYVLSNPALTNGDATIRAMTPATACMALLEHGFRLDPTAHDESVRMLRQAAAVAKATPAYSLTYPHDFSQQDRLIDLLSTHLEGVVKEPT